MIVSMRRVARTSVQSVRRYKVTSSLTPSSKRAPHILEPRISPATLLFLDHTGGVRCEYDEKSPHWRFCKIRICSPADKHVIFNHNILRIMPSWESSIVVHEQNRSDLIQLGIFSTSSSDDPKTEQDSVSPHSQATTSSTSPNEDPKKPAQKLTLWQKAKKEIVHYYHGFRLLGLEVKIASGICLRLLWGHTLTRRERKQLVRTVADIIRLVPFLVFVIVPFMEFLLPFYLKFFPFMLPSTFKEKTSETDKIRQRLKAKLEMTRFLQETLQQTSGTTSVAETSPTISQFQEFLETVQKSGQPASTEDITRFSKLFEDQITLDSLEMKQLKMLCQLLSLPTIGPSNLLRFQIWMRVRQLKAEDQLIAKEGVDELPVWELQSLCQERGMRSAGLTVERLRSQLSQWLTLHLEKNVPVTLLLFSRALHVSKASLDEFLLKEAIAQLPPSASEEITTRVLEATPHIDMDPRTKIEVLRKEQANIEAARAQRKQELAEQKAAQPEIKSAKPDTKDEQLVDKAPVIKDASQESVEEPDSRPSPVSREAFDAEATTVATADARAVEAAQRIPLQQLTSLKSRLAAEPSKAAELVNDVLTKKERRTDRTKEEDTQISMEDLAQIESAIAHSSDALSQEALEGLKEEVAETVKMRAKHEATLISPERVVDKRTSKAAARLAARVGRMIGEMDTLVDKLSNERQELLKDIEIREVHVKHSTEPAKQTEMLDAIKADHERVVDINDLLLSLRRIQKVPDDTRWQKILEVLDEDNDGKIELQHVLQVIELLGAENVKLNSKEVKRVLEMLDNEEILEKIAAESPGNDSQLTDDAIQPEKSAQAMHSSTGSLKLSTSETVNQAQK